MNQKKLAITITFAGTVPFLVCALLIWLDFRPLFFPGSLKLIAHSYAVVVTSFTCGTQWGIHLSRLTRDSLYLFSGIITLAMWASLTIPGSNPGIVITVAGLLLLWILDFRLFNQRELPAWFFGLRTIASLIAILCLLFIVLF